MIGPAEKDGRLKPALARRPLGDDRTRVAPVSARAIFALHSGLASSPWKDSRRADDVKKIPTMTDNLLQAQCDDLGGQESG